MSCKRIARRNLKSVLTFRSKKLYVKSAAHRGVGLICRSGQRFIDIGSMHDLLAVAMPISATHKELVGPVPQALIHVLPRTLPDPRLTHVPVHSDRFQASLGDILHVLPELLLGPYIHPAAAHGARVCNQPVYGHEMIFDFIQYAKWRVIAPICIASEGTFFDYIVVQWARVGLPDFDRRRALLFRRG